MIQSGDTFPDAVLGESLEFGDACPIRPTQIRTTEALQGKRVVIFGLPGAFTTTCSAKHLPGYLAQLDALRAKGIDEVWCIAVNDGQVMAAWGKEQGTIGKIRMLGDGTADLARKLGLAIDLPLLGTRMRRSSMLVENGVVKIVNVEEGPAFAVSSAEHMLGQL